MDEALLFQMAYWSFDWRHIPHCDLFCLAKSHVGLLVLHDIVHRLSGVKQLETVVNVLDSWEIQIWQL